MLAGVWGTTAGDEQNIWNTLRASLSSTLPPNCAMLLLFSPTQGRLKHGMKYVSRAVRNNSNRQAKQNSIQNFNYLLQFNLWNSPSLSVRSLSTLYSSKTITICIWCTSLCHPPCKHKNIWWKIFFFCWPICLEQFASNTPILILSPLSKPPSRRTCLIIISKLFFTALPIPSSNAMCVSVCVVSVIVKRPVLPPFVVDGRSRNPLYYYY